MKNQYGDISPETHARIYELGQQGLSDRQVSRTVGCAYRTANKYKKIPPGQPAVRKDREYPHKHPEQIVSESSEIRGDDWTISLPKTRICTLDELVAHCKIDLSIWDVERFVCNKYEVGMKPAATTEYMATEDGRQIPAWVRFEKDPIIVPLFQVKAFLRKRKDIIAVRQEIEALKEDAKRFMLQPIKIKRSPKLTGNMLELNLPDIHFGKQAWSVETGWSDYDIKIAEKIYRDAFTVLLGRVQGYEFDEIVFVVGNDIMQSDNPEDQTYKGTKVSCDSRYYKVFRLVCRLMIESIETLRHYAKRVKVIMVRGNHDTLSVWHLGESLGLRFTNYKDVEIENEPRPRKYHRFGKVMLMFTHGHEGKPADYPMHMAVEKPEMWAATEFRECHTGHKHTKQDSKVPQVGEKVGVRVRILSALCPVDDWHADNGYIGNLQSAEAFVWNKDEGLIATAIYNVKASL
jgi:hypothetical protein